MRRPHSHNIVTHYFMRHIQAAFNSLGQLSRSPYNTIMTCMVIGIALALPMTLFVLLKNIDVLSKSLQQTTQITLYMQSTATEESALNLLHNVEKNPNIREAHIISPAEGLKELQEQAGIANVLANLQSNPLPWAILALPIASLHTADALSDLSHSLQKLPEVDAVQLDSLWIERLFALLSLAHRVVYALAIFLGLGVLLIVNNCIRTATQNNRSEIDLIKLIGGTHAFIRRPFLYAGILYGLLGGIVAWQLVDLFILWIKSPTNYLAALYGSSLQLLNINLLDTFLLLFISIGLGLFGAWLAVTRYLYRRRA